MTQKKDVVIIGAARTAIGTFGGSLKDICRVDVYVRNMEHFERIHKVRREYFEPPLPASTMTKRASALWTPLAAGNR